MPPVQRTPTNIGITLISLQTRVSALHFRRWQYGSIFIQILVLGSERQAHNVTKWNISLQSHLRSRILVPIESAYTYSYWWSIAIWNLSCTVSEIRRLKCRKSTIFPTHSYSGSNMEVFPLEQIDNNVGVRGKKKGWANQPWNYFPIIPTYRAYDHDTSATQTDRRTDG